MIVNDPNITKMIKERKTIEIDGKQLYIIANKRGTCDGCYFDQFNKSWPDNSCPRLAVTICCSNGGNIFEEVK